MEYRCRRRCSGTLEYSVARDFCVRFSHHLTFPHFGCSMLTTTTTIYIMPRRPLQEISTNTHRGKDLDSFELGQISGLHKAGVGVNEIGEELQRTHSTVSGALNRITTQNTTAPRKRPGRPPSWSP